MLLYVAAVGMWWNVVEWLETTLLIYNHVGKSL